MIPPRPRDMNRGRMPGAWWTARDRTHLTRRLFRLLTLQRAPITPYLLALWSGRHLVRTGPDTRFDRGGVVAVVAYRGEASLLPTFLSHHRALGVRMFVLLDLSPDGNLAAALVGERDCVVWRARRSELPSVDRVRLWLDFLRHHYARGLWCVSLDACELLVFSRCETRSIDGLTDFLQTEHRDHAFAIVVEMYGEGPCAASALGEAISPAGKSPFELAPYFDAVGYLTADPSEDGSVTTAGGVRRRTLFNAMPGRTPRLDRIPLVRWRRRFTYAEGTSVLRPKRLNTPHGPWHSSPTACLLRFSLLGSGQASGPDERALAAATLLTEASRRYTSSEDLVDCGLLNPGQWF